MERGKRLLFTFIGKRPESRAVAYDERTINTTMHNKRMTDTLCCPMNRRSTHASSDKRTINMMANIKQTIYTHSVRQTDEKHTPCGVLGTHEPPPPNIPCALINGRSIYASCNEQPINTTAQKKQAIHTLENNNRRDKHRQTTQTPENNKRTINTHRAASCALTGRPFPESPGGCPPMFVISVDRSW